MICQIYNPPDKILLMHIVITDSGLGGLSVCAQLIQLLKNCSVTENSDSPTFDLIISYVNAVPSNDKRLQ